jgi:hypothetical protein
MRGTTGYIERVDGSTHLPVDATRITCAYCGYDLSGSSVGGRCPECGARVADSVRVASRSGGSGDIAPVLCLVFGLLAVVAGCTPLGVVAIWQYGLAKRAIAQGRAPSDQMAMATIGMVLGWVGVALLGLQVLFGLAFFGLALLGI